MIVDLTSIEGSSLPFELTVPRSEIDLEETNITLTTDLRTVGNIVKHAAQIDVSGRIDGTAEIDCTRCLGPISQPLAIEFAVSFVAPEHFAAEKEREVSAEDLDTDILEGERLDLKETVREQVLLNLPEQMLCKLDCKGLCPKCGADRNLIDCKCDKEEIDPRWDALKDFRS
jgi:uncharacterized protein